MEGLRDWLQCTNLISLQPDRSHEVVFGKRAVVGAVRVFEPTSGYVFLNSTCLPHSLIRLCRLMCGVAMPRRPTFW